jgi:WD40 repeat protein
MRMMLLSVAALPLLGSLSLEHAPAGEPAAGQKAPPLAPVVQIAGAAEEVGCLAFTPDGKVLAAGSWKDGKVRFWDVTTGKALEPTFTHPAWGDIQEAIKLAFSPDGALLASTRRSHEGQLRLWDWKAGREVTRLEGLMTPSDLAFAPDGKTLAVVDSRHILLIDIAKKALAHKLPHKDGGLYSFLAFSPDGKKLAVSGMGFSRLRIWNCDRQAEETVLHSERGSITGIAWTKDGKGLITVGPAQSISCWDVGLARKSKQFGYLPGLGSGPFPSLAVSPDDKLVAVGIGKARTRNEGPNTVTVVARGKEVQLWDPVNLKDTVLRDCWLPVMSPDGRLLATASHVRGTHGVAVWDAAAVRKAIK